MPEDMVPIDILREIRMTHTMLMYDLLKYKTASWKAAHIVYTATNRGQSKISFEKIQLNEKEKFCGFYPWQFFCNPKIEIDSIFFDCPVKCF